MTPGPARAQTDRIGPNPWTAPLADPPHPPVQGPGLPAGLRPAWAEIELAAIAHNARGLNRISGQAELCAVVKANGYGHGSVASARAARQGGATWLGVALVEEGVALRTAGLDGPILVLSQPPSEHMGRVVEHRLIPAIYTADGLRALDAAAMASGCGPVEFHLKVDTGMHRVGAVPRDVEDLIGLARRLDGVTMSGIFTHLAVADEPDNPYTGTQLDRFSSVLGSPRLEGEDGLIIHAANSAACLGRAETRMDMVRCGIALYGLAPAEHPEWASKVEGLRPALSLKARVSHVKTLAGGEAVSYGLRHRLTRDSVVATVPLGYADGVPRSLGLNGGQVLIGGRRLPVIGTVTMDQLMVDCGPAATVEVGDEVVLIGRQQDAQVTAWEWASATGTIAYEIVCGISARIPRVYL